MSARAYYATKRAGKAKETKRFVTGFCNPSNPPAIHATCKKHWAGRCDCDCHTISEAATSTPAASGQPFEVTGPSVFEDLDETEYHRDPVPERLGRSLSHSGAKVLMGTTPAHFHWQREHGQKPKKAFDFGTAAHAKVLGVGAELVVHEFDPDKVKSPKSTNAWKFQERVVREAGGVLLLPDEHAKVEAMAAKLAEHPDANALLTSPYTEVEQSLFWQDPATEVWRRARLDIARLTGPGVPLVGDYKTCTDASVKGFTKAAIDYGYFTQDPWYCDGVAELGLAARDEVLFVFIAQEKEPPYEVAVHYLDEVFIAAGLGRNRRALETYAECQGSGIWPGYPVEPAQLKAPDWFIRKYEEYL